MADTRISQTGSIRTYVASPEGVSTWTISIDAAENQVIAARLSQQGAGTASLRGSYACDGNACQGFSIGRPDAHGVRTITVRAARLKPASDEKHLSAQPPRLPSAKSHGHVASEAGSAGSAPVDSSVRLTATLRTVPEQQIPELACKSAAVSMVASDGGVTQFCASAGSGFAVADDGQRLFEFRNFEGQTLVVHVARDGQLQRVVFGDLACTACSGVFMRPAGPIDNPSVERTFSFAGTRLTAAGRDALSMTLSGDLTMTSQE